MRLCLINVKGSPPGYPSLVIASAAKQSPGWSETLEIAARFALAMTK
jgi:hypothetical protein